MKHLISAREYERLLQLADPNRAVIQQKRIAFLWNHASYVIHAYAAPVDNLAVLHVQGDCASTDALPPFVDVDTSTAVLDDDETSAYAISAQYGKQ